MKVGRNDLVERMRERDAQRNSVFAKRNRTDFGKVENLSLFVTKGR